jgi:hypothetical protein
MVIGGETEAAQRNFLSGLDGLIVEINFENGCARIVLERDAARSEAGPKNKGIYLDGNDCARIAFSKRLEFGNFCDFGRKSGLNAPTNEGAALQQREDNAHELNKPIANHSVFIGLNDADLTAYS